MTLRRNIGFGLKTAKLPRAEKERRIEEVAALLGMTDYLDRRPAQLSGGQRQRVAIGRAMVRDPAVFLFDEPLSNLDAQLRTQMRLEIKKLHQRVGTTIVYVTHDQIEAMTMADRIVIMRSGHIQQVGTPSEVYHRPANVFVAQFIGAPSMNLLPGTWTGGAVQLAGGGRVPVPGARAAEGQKVVLGVRPADLHPVAAGAPALVSGTIAVVEPLGAETLIHVTTPGGDVIASDDGRSAPVPGAAVALGSAPDSLHLFDAENGAALA
jgi:multiple sugar transport system ATP-binding protein